MSADEYFDQNDTIAAFLLHRDYSGVLFSNGPGYLQIPTAGINEYCNDMNYATFENAISASQNACIRKIEIDLSETSYVEQFTQQCQSVHSVQKYVTQLYVAK